MRFTSSARRFIALLASLFLLLTTGTGPQAKDGSQADPCVLVKLAAESIPPGIAAERLRAVQALLGKRLRVRWVPPKEADGRPPEGDGEFPVADDGAIRAVASLLREAGGLMDGMETERAGARLSEAETLARSYRFGDSVRPFLAEIFLKKGLLFLWEGETEKAERMLSRSRALRPDFDPDPAMFSPLFLEAWQRSGSGRPPRAEILVTSTPSGAGIFLDGREAGTTPGRVTVSTWGPVRLRVAAKGYEAAAVTRQWLPGDVDALEFPLARDRNAVLADSLSSSPDGREAGPLLSRMIAEAGAARSAVLLLEEGGNGPTLRVISLAAGESRPALLGTIDWPEADDAAESVAVHAADLLTAAGWPAETEIETAGSPWYHRWWFWTLLGVAIAGAAAGIGGGGGGGSPGGSAGTIGVNF